MTEGTGGLSASVLVVEDDPDLRTMVERTLRRLGHAVTAVADGPAALAALDSGSAFDLLFTDVKLPGGMNGVEVARAARQRRPGLPVLLTSGLGVHATPLGRPEPGMALIGKPYRTEELRTAIAALLGHAPDPVG